MFQSGVTGLVGSLGAVSKIVLLLLFVASILSWGVIFYKWRSFKAADREDQRFFSAFTKIRDLDELYRQSKRAEGSPSARVFQGIMDRVLTVSGDGAMTVPQPAGTSKEQVSSIDHQYMYKTVAYLVQNQVSQLSPTCPSLPPREISPHLSVCWAPCWGLSIPSARSDYKERPALRRWRRACRRRWWRRLPDCSRRFLRSSFTTII